LNVARRTSNGFVTRYSSLVTRHGHSIILALLLSGCASGPSPIVVYQDDRTQITLAVDPAAGAGHQHPYMMSAEQMAQVLSGVWVKDRNAVTGFGLFKDAKGSPAFRGTMVTRLAEPLARALGRASTRDLVTFYVSLQDRSRGPVVTSGGLFVRNDRLYLMLANAHTMPSETSNDFSTAIELDNRDAPLEPIGRFRFMVGFSPGEAWIPYAEAKRQTGYEPYMDASKLVVIDLSRLSKPPAP
jgi:hypothetical protein